LIYWIDPIYLNHSTKIWLFLYNVGPYIPTLSAGFYEPNGAKC